MKKFSNFTKKKKTITISYKHLPLWILGALLLFLISAFFTGSKSVFELYNLHQERNQLLDEKNALETKNKELLEEIELLQNDLDAIEKVAREQYNLKKEGETVYKVAPEKNMER